LGTATINNSTSFSAVSSAPLDIPVMVFLQAAQGYVANPLPTGSVVFITTIGIVLVACFAAGVSTAPSARDEVYFLTYQFLRESAAAFRIAVRISRFEHEMLTLDITVFAQPVNQRSILPRIHQRVARNLRRYSLCA
jgi:hypothetical protein